MKNIYYILFVLSAILFTGCEINDKGTDIPWEIDFLPVTFTGCYPNQKSAFTDKGALRLRKQENYLFVKAINTEFCCGTDSIQIMKNTNDDEISAEIIDKGPFTWCFCPHDVEFYIGPLSDKEYTFTFIESENSYLRDTFLVRFDFSDNLDTTVYSETKNDWISSNPLQTDTIIKGGCNGDFSNEPVDFMPEEPDTIIFTAYNDSLNIFTGLNLTCCIDFGTGSEIHGDTLIMRIETLNDLFCDCICYYTFDFTYRNYNYQKFYYKFYIDDYIRKEGEYNLP